MPALSQISEELEVAFNSHSDANLISSMLVKRWSLKVLFIFGDRKKKSRCVLSGPYGSWDIFTFCFWPKIKGEAIKFENFAGRTSIQCDLSDS